MRDRKIVKSLEETKEKMTSDLILPNHINKPFLNINEACLLIGVSRTTLWRLIKNERLKGY